MRSEDTPRVAVVMVRFTNLPWLESVVVKSAGLTIRRSRVWLSSRDAMTMRYINLLFTYLLTTLDKPATLHTCAAVTKHYYFVLAGRLWRSEARKVIVGLASYWPRVRLLFTPPAGSKVSKKWRIWTPTPMVPQSMEPLPCHTQVLSCYLSWNRAGRPLLQARDVCH